MIKILHLLCPQRHCILAAVFDDRGETSEPIKAEFEEMVANKTIGRHCGICGSTRLAWHETDSPFPSLEVGTQILRMLQSGQLAMRAVLEMRGKTFDAQARLARN